MKAVFIDCTSELDALFTPGHATIPDNVTIHRGDPSRERIIDIAKHHEVLMVEHTIIPDELFSQTPELRATIFMGTGYSTYVDKEKADAAGVELLTTPGYGTTAVAEHASALMMAGARQSATTDRDLRSGKWLPRGGLQLAEQKVAVIGMGGIGQRFANFATVLAWMLADGIGVSWIIRFSG